MIQLQLNACVSLESLSNAHHWSEHRDLDSTEPIENPDFAHYTHRKIHYCLHPQSCQGQLVLEYLLLLLDEKEVLVQQVERLNKFQVRFGVFHRPHLHPWTCAFCPQVIHSAAFLLWFSSLFAFVDPVSVSLPVLVLTLYGRSRDFVDSRLLNLHLRPELPESGSAELRIEAQQVVAAGWHAMMNVEVLAHAIWIFRLFWSVLLFSSDLSVQLMVVVQLMVMRDSHL